MDISKGNNPEGMEICGDEDSETGFLQNVSVGSLDLSSDSLKGSYNLPTNMFSLDQSNILQRSQGFCVTEPLQPGTSTQTVNPNLFLAVGRDTVNMDVKPVLMSNDFGFTNTCTSTSGARNVTSQPGSVNPNQTVFNTSALVMSLQSNPGTLCFGQPSGANDAFKSENVFTFGSNNSETSRIEIGGGVVESSEENMPAETKGLHSKHGTKHRQKKSRSRSASNDNVQKTEPQPSTSPSRFEAAELQGTSEMGFKPSLLDEILTEKKLTLMRSPEVIQFLQSQQRKISHGQYTES